MALMDLQDFWGLAEANAGQRAEEEGAVRMGDPVVQTTGNKSREVVRLEFAHFEALDVINNLSST
ncbi:hypothetical protein GX48_00389 [Paracoccidioides brasiliensis]|nr:hypothetical protein GX48_00389 [Paracoccidioides brasiliensis]